MKDAKKTGSASKDKAAAKSKTSGTADDENGSFALSKVAQAVAGTDAEELLKADHRKVEELFEQYKNSDDEDEKSELAEQICHELIVHTKLEEEIFYPACREKNVEDDTMDEAQVEHDGAKIMIAELMNGSPEDDYFDAKVTVLSEYIKHHVGEEEKPGEGIFAKAREAGVDMNALGARIQARRSELMDNIDALSSRPPKPRSLDLGLMTGGQRNQDQQDQESDTMARYSNTPERDEYGRFVRDDDDDRGSRSRGFSRGGSNYRERDEQGRFMSEDDEDNGRGRSRGGYSTRSSRYEDDDDRMAMRFQRGGRGGPSRSGSNYRERDEMGRFMSEDDEDNGRGRSRSSRFDDDDRMMGSSRGRGGQGHGGWFGDPEGHSEAAERGWEHRASSRGGYPSRSSSRYDEDDDRGSRSRGQGHGGWFGDPEGHSEAAERGWEHRMSSRGGSSRRSSRYDEDDDRGSRSSRSGRGQGHGGWYGDPRGHSEAAKRGWEDR